MRVALSARAAAIRGDDYHHAVGWLWACWMLDGRGILSVSVEDPDGGAFDDVVVRRRTGGHTYIQAKSSNYADRIVDREMLLSPARPGGKSPLQRFYDTYARPGGGRRGVLAGVLDSQGIRRRQPAAGGAARPQARQDRRGPDARSGPAEQDRQGAGRLGRASRRGRRLAGRFLAVCAVEAHRL